MYIVLSKEWAIMDILLKITEANLMYSSIYNTSSVSDYQLTIHPLKLYLGLACGI